MASYATEKTRRSNRENKQKSKQNKIKKKKTQNHLFGWKLSHCSCSVISQTRVSNVPLIPDSLFAAIANGSFRALKLWKLSSQALVGILIALILARLLQDLEKPKIQRSSGASKTLGPSSERQFNVRPSAERRNECMCSKLHFRQKLRSTGPRLNARWDNGGGEGARCAGNITGKPGM